MFLNFKHNYLPQKALANSADPDQTASEETVLVCYSDKHFVNSSPDSSILFERKRKVFQILEHLP